MNRRSIGVFIGPALLALAIALSGCVDDSAQSTAQETSTPVPQPPAWLQFQPGTKALLSTADPTDPVLGSTVLACVDSFSYEHHGEEDDPGGCVARTIGQVVTIKSHDVGSYQVTVHGDGWSGVVGDDALSPVVPAGVIMDCSGESGSIKLYSKDSPRHHIYDLQDGDEYLKVLRTRSSDDLIGPYVRVVKGYGVGDTGFVRQDELAQCFLKGNVQIAFPDN